MFIHAPTDLGYDDLEVINSDIDGRRYVTPNGKRYPSITTVLSVRDKGFLTEWRDRVGDKEADRVCHHAATRGNALHDLAERYLKNEEIDTRRLMPHVALGFKTVKKILDEHVGTVYAQEKALYSDHLRLSGRVDLIATWDGVLSVIDFKTSNRFKSEDDITDYFIQESAYSVMWEERTGIPITNLITIMIVDSQSKPLIFKNHRDKWTADLIDTIELYAQTNKN